MSMSVIESALRAEEQKHRDATPSPRRDVADLLHKAANEVARLNRERDELIAYLNGISRQTANMVTAHGGIRQS